jgi:predicted DNA-binding protein (MmcQ/YjbR family)
VVEEFPFGPETSVFKVGGKMFALTALSARPLTVSLKCEPSLSEALRAEHSAVRPGYHLNKRHWITVTLDDSLPDELVLGSSRTAMSWSSTGCRSASATSFAPARPKPRTLASAPRRRVRDERRPMSLRDPSRLYR